MAEYNSSLIEEFSDIWVFCEQRDGKLMPTDYELISEGRGIGFKILSCDDIIHKLSYAVNLSEEEKDRIRQRGIRYLKENNSEEMYLKEITELADKVV